MYLTLITCVQNKYFLENYHPNSNLPIFLRYYFFMCYELNLFAQVLIQFFNFRDPVRSLKLERGLFPYFFFHPIASFHLFSHPFLHGLNLYDSVNLTELVRLQGLFLQVKVLTTLSLRERLLQYVSVR